jgi:hypothetical protein
VKDLVDEIIAEEFFSPDLELHWLDEDADTAELERSLEGRVKLGAVTLNEMRDALGLDPYANPAADRPMVLTLTGYVPIEANAGGSAFGVGIQIRREQASKKPSSPRPMIRKSRAPQSTSLAPDSGRATEEALRARNTHNLASPELARDRPRRSGSS